MRRSAAQNRAVLIRWTAGLIGATAVVAEIYVVLHFVVKYW